MATHTLGEFVRNAYEKLQGLAADFGRQGNEEASGILAALRRPALPMRVRELLVEYPQETGEAVAARIAVGQTARLAKAGDVLVEAGRYKLADRVTTDANEVRDAVGRRDQTTGLVGQPPPPAGRLGRTTRPPATRAVRPAPGRPPGQRAARSKRPKNSK
jgi:hypothetical protein